MATSDWACPSQHFYPAPCFDPQHLGPLPSDEVKLCTGCNTAKHLDSEGFCGRCAKRRKVTYITGSLQLLTMSPYSSLDETDEDNCENAVDEVMVLLKNERDKGYLDGKLEAYEVAEMHDLVKPSHIKEWRIRIEQLREELAKFE